MKRLLFLFAAGVAIALGAHNARAAAETYKIIHAFAGGKTDGSTPTIETSLTPAGSDFYGVTLSGGQYTNGVVFEIPTNGGAIKLIHSFNGWSILNQNGSKNDGAYPVGTPVVTNSTIYGMTQEGGSNGPAYGIGTVYSVNTDGTGFKILHHFGAENDGYAPYGSLILSGSTLFGMTALGGTNGISEGVVFSIETNGSNYQILQSFIDDGGASEGSLILWGTSLYGMTAGEVFRVETNGSNFIPIHYFGGGESDGATAYGSLTRSGAYLYGMTSSGGTNNVGTMFQINLIGSVFKLLHSFSLEEAWTPHGDLVLSGSMLYGMAYDGVTNLAKIGYLGNGAVFQINTNGSDYQLLHVFGIPLTGTDGAKPFGTPLILGSELYGMTSLGGSAKDGGCIFSLSITPSSLSQPPAITNSSPLPNGSIDVVYDMQFGASGGATPYTWALSSGTLPKGLTLSASGILTGKPTVGGTSDFSIKVTDHNKLTSTQSFVLTIEAPPKLVITTPKTNQKVTTPTLNVSGTASGAVALTGVWFQLNHGTWTKAQTSDAFAHWNFPNPALLADTNIFSTYAVDADGNFSTTNTVTFTYYVTSKLTVTTAGSGSFTPADNGKQFQVGATFPITAKPATGFLFTDWTDGSGNILSQAAAYKFVMASNLTIIANFTAKPKPALAQNDAQNFVGLFGPSGNTRAATNSGAIRLALTSSGAFSGNLLLGSGTLPFTGRFDSNGAAQIVVDSQTEKAFSVALQLDAAHDSVIGTVSDGTFASPLLALGNDFNASHPATNYEGNYWFTISGASKPASATVDSLGNVIFTAALSGGSIVSQTSQISNNGWWPLYVPPAGNGISLWNWLQISNGAVQISPSQK